MNLRLPAAERRTLILDAALHEFAAKGFHATSMNDVARTGGVTKPVLYQHFASKRALYLALIDDVAASMLEAIGKATTDAPDGQNQTQSGIIAYFEWMAANRTSFVLLFGSGARRDEEFSAALRNIERLIADAIAPLIDAGLDREHQRRIAYALVGMSEGVSRYLIANGESFDPALVGSQLANFAWAGLRGIEPQ
ncbi:MAG: TetR/AcrR family transcriptional regulator [Ilumatobacteraceae bacterium]|jgi:AcrR family transcriptional regulator|nr:TetR/AcrR family transcriptional regulator [Ilumatobacteraceae bacterium]